MYRTCSCYFIMCYNSHPDCQRVKMQLANVLRFESLELCPKEYRHLLRDERRPELKNRKVELW